MGFFMKISKHAAEQMARRGIGTPNVLAVLIHGEEAPTNDPELMKHSLEGLVVVMDYRRDVVVTTYHQIMPRPRAAFRGRSKFRGMAA